MPSLNISQFEQLRLKSPNILNLIFNISKKHLAIHVARFSQKHVTHNKIKHTQPQYTLPMTEVDYSSVKSADVLVVQKLLVLVETIEDDMVEFDVQISDNTSSYKVNISQIPDIDFQHIEYIKSQLCNYILDVKFDFFNNLLVFIVNKNVQSNNDIDEPRTKKRRIMPSFSFSELF